MNDGMPVLLPYQRRWVEDLSPVKVMEKSRRVGISWAEAADDTLLAATDGPEGMDVWYIGYNQDMAREYVNDCAFWARHYNRAASGIEEVVLRDEDRDILAYRIKFASGRRVTALTSRPSNLRGKQGKVVIDEAAFHDDLPGLLKAAVALIMWGGRVAVISSHFGDDNPFNELVQDIRAGRKPYSLHRVTLDEALREGLYRRICGKLGRAWSPEAEAAWRQELIDFYGDAAEEELFCIPSKGSGIYLPRALIESCMDPTLPVIRWRCSDEFAMLADAEREAICRDWMTANLDPHLEALDPNLATATGDDFGRTGDLSVKVVLQRTRKLAYRAPFVIELRNVPFRQQEQIHVHVCDRLPRFSGAALDARGNGQYLAERATQLYGAWRVRPVMLSTEWYRDNMPRYKAAFEDGLILLPRDADILDDHRLIRMEKGVAKVPENAHTRGTDGGQRHGDSAVAGALAYFAATQIDAGPIEYERVVARRAALFDAGCF